MIRSIVESSLRLRFLVIVVAAGMLLFGIARLRHMPVDVLPEFAPPYVEIQTEALGLSAAEVEALVTIPLEELLHGVSWLQTMRSESHPGLSSIFLTFEPGTDLMRARALVQERLTEAQGLPSRNVAKTPVMLQPLSSTSRVMMIGLSSDELSLIDMSVLTRWTIQPRLMGVPGVANVTVWGRRERQLQVQVDPESLRAHGLTLQQIIKTSGDALWVSPLSFLKSSTPGVTGGFIDTPNQRLGIRHLLPISSPDDLAQVTVAESTLRLGDVARVVEDHQPLIGDAVLGDGTGLLLIVEKFPWGNTMEVTRGVEQALEELGPGLRGMQLDTTIFRPATFIELAVDNLSNTLLIAAVLLVLMLGLFLFNWRTLLISLVAIVVSLLAAGLVLYLRGATINAMILAGFVIALSAIAGDAIMDVENIARRLQQQRAEGSDRSATSTIISASLEMRGTLFFALLIMILAVTPVFFVEGLSGAFFRPLALSYILALLASMAVALVVTPVLCLLFLGSAQLGRRQSPIIPWFQRGCNQALARTVDKPCQAYSMLATLIVAGLLLLPFLEQSLLPALKETDVLVRWTSATGTSHPEMVRITKQGSEELRSIPGVGNLGAHIGRAIMGDELVNVNSAGLWLNIAGADDYDATMSAIRRTLDSYPGLHRDVQTYLQDGISQALTGSDSAVTVRIYGPDLQVLRDQAEKVHQALSRITGVVDMRVEPQLEEPQVEVKLDFARAHPYGLKPGDVRRAAATLVNGIEVGNLFEEQKVFEVVVRGAPETRHSVTSLRDLLVDTPNGGHVRLEDVADLQVVPGSTLIKREGASRYVDVGFNVQDRDVASVTREAEQRLAEIEFPLEYHPRVFGEYTERQAAQGRMLGFLAAAAVGIFLLLQAALGSWRLAMIGFATLLGAVAGGIIAAFIAGGDISLGSQIGFLGVLGIAARQVMLLINRYQYLQQHEGEPFGRDLVLRGTQERLVPMILTAIIAAVIMLPLVVVGDIAGHEIVRPIAVVMLGGLLSSTLLSLLVIPSLYLRFGSHAKSDIWEPLSE